MPKYLIRLGFVEELMQLLRQVFAENIPDDVVSNISKLSFDIVLCKGSTTLSADGVGEWCVQFKLGSNFEDLMAALRAGKFTAGIHESKL